MSTTTKRRIQVASFSTSDISRANLVTMVMGFVLVVGAAALTVTSTYNTRAASDSKGAARILSTVSGLAQQGTKSYVGGGADRLTLAAASASQVSAAFNDVFASANSPLVLPNLKNPAADAYISWGNLSTALNAIGAPAGLTADISDAMGRATPNFAALVKKLEATQKQYSAYGRAYESAVRLYTYAEAGFGMASTPRVEYDLQTLVSDLGQGELRQDVAFAALLLDAAHAAATASKKVTREQLTAVFDAATAAKPAADALNAVATQSQMAQWLGMGAVGLAVLGVLAIVSGLRGAASEFSKRYTRSVQQFRGDEQSYQELQRGLGEIAAGDFSQDVAVTAASGEYANIAASVNELLQTVRARLDAAASAMRAGVESGSEVLELVVDAKTSGASVAADLQDAAVTLDACSNRSGTMALDSRALLSAAGEVATRSSDATRVAQDAASRLDAMRDGLQDTAKRIKRLGERTQEINAVVDTMDVLSEQIGVVALNASLEAERAGDAGAGFRLVAREVQALAARSQEAMEKISGLVQGVQADARSAGESVERSTGQVVSGANVGAVSHALLSVLAPLSESVSAMAQGLAEHAESNATAVAGASKAAREAHRAVVGVVEQVDNLRDPLNDGQRSMDSGLTALVDTRVEESLV